MFSYLPLRTYLLSLLIIGGIFSLKAQEKEHKAPEEQTIKRYKGFKLELAIPFNRFAIYQDGALGSGLIYLAPQYYIHNNISVGLQYEADFNLVQGEASHSFMVTSDYYLTNGKNRPSVGLGVGAGNGYLVFSPRFKLHLPWIALHSSYDINTHVHSSFRLGAAITLFGKAKKKKNLNHPKKKKKKR